VDDADAAFEEALRRGAKPALEPADRSDKCGGIRQAAIHTYGDTIHSFISYKDYRGPFLPASPLAKSRAKPWNPTRRPHRRQRRAGKMNEWAEWYSRVLGFRRFISFDDKDISTEYSA